VLAHSARRRLGDALEPLSLGAEPVAVIVGLEASVQTDFVPAVANGADDRSGCGRFEQIGNVTRAAGA
jgi:hypothetical protein